MKREKEVLCQQTTCFVLLNKEAFMRLVNTLSVALWRIVLYSFLILICSSFLYAGTTSETIPIGSYPITIKDIKSGEETTENLHVDVEAEFFICDEQEKKVGTYKYSLGKETCERHCLTCPACGGPGKDKCDKGHSREREVPIKKCERTIKQIVEAAKKQVLKDLQNKKVTSSKGKSVYLFKPGEDGNVLAKLDAAIGNAVKDGEESHSDFTKPGEQKGKIRVSAAGHAGICEKSENELSYEQTKYAVTVHVKITIKLVKYLPFKDPITGEPRKDQFTEGEDKEIFTYTYDQRMPVGYRYKYTGKSGGWKVIYRCTCCKPEEGGEPVSSEPVVTPLTPEPVSTPVPAQEKEQKKTGEAGKPDEAQKTGYQYGGEGAKLPAGGALGSFVISPDTTVAVKSGGASSSFFINEEGKKTGELEKKGNYFIGKVPGIISGGIVTGGVVTAVITTLKGATGGTATGIATTPSSVTTAAPSPGIATIPTPGTTAAPSPGITTIPSPGATAAPSPGLTTMPSPGVTTAPSPGISATPYYDATMPTSIKANVPNVDMNKLDMYNLSATPQTGEMIDYGSPDMYLIDNRTNAASTVYDVASGETLPPGKTTLTLTDPEGNVIDEKEISVYSYNLSFNQTQVSRGMPVAGNGTVTGIDGSTQIEVTLTFDPILDVSVASGQITRKAPGIVTYKTTVNQFNLQPADFVFDTSKGVGKKDVGMIITPVDADASIQDATGTETVPKTDKAVPDAAGTVKPGELDVNEKDVIKTITPSDVDK
jgi:hypothetical protein